MVAVGRGSVLPTVAATAPLDVTISFHTVVAHKLLTLKRPRLS
jgi:hypothetical protein